MSSCSSRYDCYSCTTSNFGDDPCFWCPTTSSCRSSSEYETSSCKVDSVLAPWECYGGGYYESPDDSSFPFWGYFAIVIGLCICIPVVVQFCKRRNSRSFNCRIGKQDAGALIPLAMNCGVLILLIVALSIPWFYWKYVTIDQYVGNCAVTHKVSWFNEKCSSDCTNACTTAVDDWRLYYESTIVYLVNGVFAALLLSMLFTLILFAFMTRIKNAGRATPCIGCLQFLCVAAAVVVFAVQFPRLLEAQSTLSGSSSCNLLSAPFLFAIEEGDPSPCDVFLGKVLFANGGIFSWGSEGLWAGAAGALISLGLSLYLCATTKASRSSCRGPSCNCCYSAPRSNNVEMKNVAPPGFERVKDTLDKLSLQQYTKNFSKQKFDWDTFIKFPNMPEKDQMKLIPELGPRNRLINYINETHKPAEPPVITPTPIVTPVNTPPPYVDPSANNFPIATPVTGPDTAPAYYEPPMYGQPMPVAQPMDMGMPVAQPMDMGMPLAMPIAQPYDGPHQSLPFEPPPYEPPIDTAPPPYEPPAY